MATESVKPTNDGTHGYLWGPSPLVELFLEKALIDLKPDYVRLTAETAPGMHRFLGDIALEGAVVPQAKMLERQLVSQVMYAFGQTVLRGALQKIADNTEISLEALYQGLYSGAKTPPITDAFTRNEAPRQIEISTYPEVA